MTNSKSPASPMDKLKQQQKQEPSVGSWASSPTRQQPAPVAPAQPQAVKASPLSTLASPSQVTGLSIIPVTSKDVEEMGEAHGPTVTSTTNRITEKFKVNNFGGLGEILTNVQIQADSLDLSEFTKKGLFAKVRRGLTDVRKLLYKRMNSANDAFTDLETRMSTQIAVLTEWNKDLAQLYQENYNNHVRLTADLEKAQQLEQQVKMALENFPAIDPNDPNAFAKSQQLQEAQNVLDMIQIKIDTWKRLRIICESHGPNLQTKQQAGRNAINTLRRLMTEMIPLIKMEFAMHLQNLEIQKTITLVDATQDLGNTVLTTAADSSRDAALAAATAMNTPMISTQTLQHIRTRMLEAVNGVSQIREQAQAQRAADDVEMEKSQQEYLKQLQSKGAI